MISYLSFWQPSEQIHPRPSGPGGGRQQGEAGGGGLQPGPGGRAWGSQINEKFLFAFLDELAHFRQF